MMKKQMRCIQEKMLKSKSPVWRKRWVAASFIKAWAPDNKTETGDLYSKAWALDYKTEACIPMPGL
jgi:hypothetical protein